MARDDTFPPPMPLAKWQADEEHNAWVVEIWARYGRAGQPRPCDCGYFPESATRLVSCSPEERAGCHATAKGRLERYWKGEREKEIRNRRVWPGPEPFAGIRQGMCSWCGEAIFRDDGFRLNLRRRRHVECAHEFLIRVQPDAMRWHVWKRDEGRCGWPGCDRVHGLYGHWDADHVKPLVLANGDLTFWNPENVRILCRAPCHKLKSAQDAPLIAAWRKERDHGPNP